MKQLTNEPRRSNLLDWYRGLGIVAVLWGHAGLPGLPGAYLFIDTFFLISGYLVCQSFRRSCAPDALGELPPLRAAIAEFLGSRFRRIAIPLVTTVLLTLIAGWVVLLPDDLFALAESAQATLFLRAHVYALSLGSYWDVVRQNAPLLHAWSLSLEEWFYLITPLMVLPALMWSRCTWLVVLVILTFASLYQAQTLSSDPEALGISYSMFSTRLWQFSLGLIFALLLQRRPRLQPRANDALLLAGIVAVFGSVMVLTEKAASPGLITLPALFGVLAVLVLRPQSHVFARLTGMPFVTFFGRKLYSLYLVHYPVMVYFSYLDVDFGTATNSVKLVLAMGLGLVFYYAVEAPMRGWRAIGFPSVLAISGILFALSLALTYHIQKTGGAPKRLPDEALAVWTARYDVNPQRARCLQPALTRFGYSCALGPLDGPFFALMGDSHSDAFANQLATVLAARGIGLRHYWYAECPAIGSGLEAMGVFSQECGRLSHEAHRSVLRDRNLAGVIYAARWPWYVNDPSAERLRAYWRNEVGLPRNYASMKAFRDAFLAVLLASAVDFQARGVPVYVMTPVPSLPSDPVKTHVVASWFGTSSAFQTLSDGLDLTSYERERAAFDRLIAPLLDRGAVALLEVRDTLCDDRSCTVYGTLGSLYYDNNHLNEQGAAQVIRGVLVE